MPWVGVWQVSCLLRSILGMGSLEGKEGSRWGSRKLNCLGAPISLGHPRGGPAPVLKLGFHQFSACCPRRDTPIPRPSNLCSWQKPVCCPCSQRLWRQVHHEEDPDSPPPRPLPPGSNVILCLTPEAKLTFIPQRLSQNLWVSDFEQWSCTASERKGQHCCRNQ